MSFGIRVLSEPEDRGGVVGQDDVAAIVGAMHDRSDVVARHLGRRIHVRDEPDRGNVVV